MTPRRLLACAVLLLSGSLLAQDVNVPKQKAEPIPKAIVTGHVTCSDTRAPARGATVMLAGLPDKSASEKGGKAERRQQQSGKTYFARVGLDGSYTVERVAPGDYAVLGFLPGYLSVFDRMQISETEDDVNQMIMDQLARGVVIHAGADGTLNGDLILERGAVITGRVLYADGAPGSMVNIELQDVDAKPPKTPGPTLDMGAMFSRILTNQSMSTDDQGNFRLSGIRSGTYRIAVVQPVSLDAMNGGAAGDGMGIVMGAGMFGGISDPNALRFYSGDTLHKRSAKTYDLRAGDTLSGIDIRLPIDGLHNVRVHLTSADGRAITQAQLTLVDTTDESFRFSSNLFGAGSDPDGLFTFHNIPPGTYTLTAQHAMIVPPVQMPDPPPQPPAQAGQPGIEGSETTFEVHPTSAFQDATSTIVVKDSDLLDVALTLTEIPKPAAAPPPR